MADPTDVPICSPMTTCLELNDGKKICVTIEALEKMKEDDCKNQQEPPKKEEVNCTPCPPSNSGSSGNDKPNPCQFSSAAEEKKEDPCQKSPPPKPENECNPPPVPSCQVTQKFTLEEHHPTCPLYEPQRR